MRQMVKFLVLEVWFFQHFRILGGPFLLKSRVRVRVRVQFLDHACLLMAMLIYIKWNNELVVL